VTGHASVIQGDFDTVIIPICNDVLSGNLIVSAVRALRRSFLWYEVIPRLAKGFTFLL
jgi:hypothetical protein